VVGLQSMFWQCVISRVDSWLGTAEVRGGCSTFVTHCAQVKWQVKCEDVGGWVNQKFMGTSWGCEDKLSRALRPRQKRLLNIFRKISNDW